MRPLLVGLMLVCASPAWAQQRIAFGSFAPLNSDVFIAAGDGSAPTALAPHPSLDMNPAFAPDGPWVVFTSYREGSADLWRVRRDGSGLERLTDHAAYEDQAAVSPDGRRVAFVSTRSGRAKLWLLDLASKTARRITSGDAGDFRPAWSPDGRWIAFSSDRDSKRPLRNFVTLHSTELYLMRGDGSNLRRLTHGGTFTGSPSWSRDGKTLYAYEATMEDVFKITGVQRLEGATQLIGIDVASGARRVLTKGPMERFGPRALADGRIAYTGWGKSGGVEFLGRPPGVRGVFEAADWTADGGAMVFHREVDEAWPPVQTWRTRDRAFQLVRTGIFPTFSPDGRRIAFNSGRAGRAHNQILVATPDGAERSVIYADAKNSGLAPVWSPDGRQVAFASGSFFVQGGNPQAASQLSLVNADGSGFRTLTPPGGIDGFPAWSPSGRELVYRRGASHGRGLAIVEVATGAIRPLTDGTAEDNFPVWAPDGQWIAFASKRSNDYDVYRIRPDGSGLTRLTSAPGNDAHLAWSSDGEWIAFSTAREGFKDEALRHHYNPQPYGEIAVMRPDGTDVRVLTDDPFEDATVAFEPGPRGSEPQKAAEPATAN